MPAATGAASREGTSWPFLAALFDAYAGTVLTETIGHAQRRRAALAHQCRSCRQLWALRREPGADGWLISCRYCGTPRAAQPREEALLQTTADVLDEAAT